jgi:hypothetical protein
LHARDPWGAELKSLILELAVDKRQSARQIREFVKDHYRISIGLGTVTNVITRTGKAFAPLAQRIKAALQKEGILFGDETTWPIGTRKKVAGHKKGERTGWIWVICSKRLAYFEATEKRTMAAAKQVISEGFAGVVHTDCYGAYNFIAAACRQLCWAHIVRHFTVYAEKTCPAEREWGRRGVAVSKEIIALSRGSTAEQRGRVMAAMDDLIIEGVAAGYATAKTLDKRRGSLWHCLTNALV